MHAQLAWALISLPWSAYEQAINPSKSLAAVGAVQWVIILFCGVMGFLSEVCVNLALTRSTGLEVIIMWYLLPVFGLASGFIILRQKVTLIAGCGVTVLLLGCLISVGGQGAVQQTIKKCLRGKLRRHDLSATLRENATPGSPT